MRTETNFEHVVFQRLREINEADTEEALISMITTKVVEKSNITDLFGQQNIIAKTVISENDTRERVDKGVFVYCNNSLVDWTFERFDTIADAVKKAVNYFNAYIICDGEVINYDALNDTTAYYYAGDKMKIVKLRD